VNRIAALESSVTSLNGKVDAQNAIIAADKMQLRDGINAALLKLHDIQNSGPPFTNTEPVNSGGGANATQPPGRCQVGQVVVGISPYKDGNGIRSIIMQCGTIPQVQIQ
jgi:hypothetical protein